jgi:hypothetical protein
VKKASLIFIFQFLFSASEAQLLDTLKSLLKQKYSADANLETRYGFINNELNRVDGVKFGIDYIGRLKLGMGLSWMNSNYSKMIITKNFTDTSTNYLKFAYLTIYANFVFYKTKHWQLSVPLQLWWQKQNNFRYSERDSKYFLLLYEPGINVQFKIFKWLGLGSDVAYRMVVKDNSSIVERISSPVYSFNILIWFDQIFFDVFPEHKISKKYGPSQW